MSDRIRVAREIIGDSPILFLDVDGVLNSERWFLSRPERFPGEVEREVHQLDPEMLRRRDEIISASGCAVVVSGTWRILGGAKRLREVFRQARMPTVSCVRIVEATPTCGPWRTTSSRRRSGTGSRGMCSGSW